MPILALVDVNAMFASCAVAEHPELAGKPVLVAGDPKDRRSIVLTASYAARAFGVRTAMPVGQALRLCPGAVCVPPDHALYQTYSDALMEILSRFSPTVVRMSIDEAYLDLTGCPGLDQGPEALAARIREAVHDELSLTVSIGLSHNPWLSKMAASVAKRHAGGVFSLEAGAIPDVIWPLAVEDFHGIGPATAARLRKAGLTTIGDLHRAGKAALCALCGASTGESLHRLSGGDDDTSLAELSGEVKSLSHECTFASNLPAAGDLPPVLLALADRVGYRMRRLGLEARTVSIRVRSSRFVDCRRQLTAPSPVRRSHDLYLRAIELSGRLPSSSFPARLVAVGVASLTPAAKETQLRFIEEQDGKRDAVEAAADAIRGRFGFGALFPLGALDGPAREGYDGKRFGTSFLTHGKNDENG